MLHYLPLADTLPIDVPVVVKPVTLTANQIRKITQATESEPDKTQPHDAYTTYSEEHFCTHETG